MLLYLYRSRIKILVATKIVFKLLPKDCDFTFYLFYWEDSKYVVWFKKGKGGPIIMLFECLFTYLPHQHTKYLNLKT